jgi:hypothetical protein
MSRQHYGEECSTNNTARCCAATRRGLAAGCDWPVRTLTGCLVRAQPVVVAATRCDHGWQGVAQIALDFVKRFVPAKPSWARAADSRWTMTSWSGGRGSATSRDEITQRRAVILGVQDNRCRGLRHTKKTDLNHQHLELSSAATILVCCARRRLARIAFCPYDRPVRWEHCLHSGRRFDSELIMSSVQPSSFALCLLMML